eukprot:gene4007-6454_t
MSTTAIHQFEHFPPVFKNDNTTMLPSLLASSQGLGQSFHSSKLQNPQFSYNLSMGLEPPQRQLSTIDTTASSFSTLSHPASTNPSPHNISNFLSCSNTDGDFPNDLIAPTGLRDASTSELLSYLINNVQEDLQTPSHQNASAHPFDDGAFNYGFQIQEESQAHSPNTDMSNITEYADDDIDYLLTSLNDESLVNHNTSSTDPLLSWLPGGIPNDMNTESLSQSLYMSNSNLEGNTSEAQTLAPGFGSQSLDFFNATTVDDIFPSAADMEDIHSMASSDTSHILYDKLEEAAQQSERTGSERLRVPIISNKQKSSQGARKRRRRFRLTETKKRELRNQELKKLNIRNAELKVALKKLNEECAVFESKLYEVFLSHGKIPESKRHITSHSTHR